MTRYVRTPAKKKDNLTAAAAAVAASVTVAAGVGLVTFYLTRLFLARQAIEESVAVESIDAPDR